MNPYHAVPQHPPPQSRPAVDLDDLFGDPITTSTQRPPHIAAIDPAPPSYDIVSGGGYSSLPPPEPPQSYSVSGSGDTSIQHGGTHQPHYYQQSQQPLHGVTAAVAPTPVSSAFPSTWSSSIAPGIVPQPLPPKLPAQQQQYISPPGVYCAQPSIPAKGTAPIVSFNQQQHPHVYAQQQQQPQLAPSSNGCAHLSGTATGAVSAAAAGVGNGAAPYQSSEEEDRVQLERIIRLRRELEQEQEREQRKREELQTWGCPVCTFRNKLAEVKCEMCGSTRAGFTAPVAADQPGKVQPQPHSVVTPSPSNAGITAWQCGMCFAPNEAHAERCKVCYAYRSSGIPVPTAAPPGTAANASTHGTVSSTPFTTDWTCSVCGEVNPPAKANCKVCNGFQRNGTPVMGKATAPRPGCSNEVHATSSANPALPTIWSCSVCTFENPVSAALCKACESGQRPRHLAPNEKDEPTTGKSNRHHSSGAKENGGAGAGGDSGHNKSSSNSQWPCETCTFINPIGRKRCDMCGAKRPKSFAADADTAEARQTAQQEAQDDAGEVEWQDDDSVTECNNCHTTFTFLIRRHHCRLCGYVFCSHCSKYMIQLTMGTLPQRVCVTCYKARLEEEGKTKKSRPWLGG